MEFTIGKKTVVYLGIGLLVIAALMWAPQQTQDSASAQQQHATTTSTNLQNSSQATETSQTANVKVEVYHFHGTHQCYSCTTVGNLAEKTVNTYFADELASGKIVFGHVNGELPENRELVQKYGARGSSLFIGTYIDGEFHKEENTRVWYKINNEQDYLTYLKGVLDKRLAGDLS